MSSLGKGPQICCLDCQDEALKHLSPADRMLHRRFIFCPDCGDKRCAKAANHRLACSAPDPAYVNPFTPFSDTYVPNRCPKCGADVDCRHTAEGGRTVVSDPDRPDPDRPDRPDPPDPDARGPDPDARGPDPDRPDPDARGPDPDRPDPDDRGH